MFIYGFIALVLAFFMLRKSRSIVLHLITFVFLAVLVFVLSLATFAVIYPDGGMISGSRRVEVMQNYIVGGALAGVLGPLLGMLAAMIGRRGRLGLR